MSACGNENGLIEVEQALQAIRDSVKVLDKENISLKNSLSRYLAEAVYSPLNLPSFDQSAVDGYALYSQHENSKDQTYQLVGEVRAGAVSNLRLQPGQAIRIFTGGKLPEGTTTVARQEIVELLSSEQIRIKDHLSQNNDIRKYGEELAQGQLLAEAGQFINMGSLAALSMAGVQTLSVYRQPKVAVVITGDEITPDQNSLSEAQVFDANGPLLKAWFEQNAMQVEIIHISDQAQAVTALFEQLKLEYDVVITTGGVSVGDYDFVRPSSFEAGFKQVFWKVRQKPGKPIYFAEYLSQAHNCYLLGLPGNPAAVYVCMQVYGSLLLNALQNHLKPQVWAKARIHHALKSDLRERFLRMIVTFNQDVLEVQPLDKQQSHMLSNLIQSNCLVRIAPNRVVASGELVDVLLI